MRILWSVPRLWDETIEAHRHAVRDAIMDATAVLVAERGLRSVTMSQVAEDAGIGRATLYKYFPDVEGALVAWHERQIQAHLEHLQAMAADSEGPLGRLRTVLVGYALIQQAHPGGELTALLHAGEHVERARSRLHDFLRELLVAAADAGTVRTDIAADELTSFCLHALTAAQDLPSKAAIRRLVTVTLAGLAPERS